MKVGVGDADGGHIRVEAPAGLDQGGREGAAAGLGGQDDRQRRPGALDGPHHGGLGVRAARDHHAVDAPRAGRVGQGVGHGLGVRAVAVGVALDRENNGGQGAPRVDDEGRVDTRLAQNESGFFIFCS